jgi:autophagy-related protein 101
VLDRLNTQDVLRAVLHAVLFHRLFGLVKPKTVDVLDVTMPGVDDADMDRLVGEKVGVFWRAVEDSPDKRGQVPADA